VNYSAFDDRIKKIKNTIDNIRGDLNDIKNDNLVTSGRSFENYHNEMSFKNKEPNTLIVEGFERNKINEQLTKMNTEELLNNHIAQHHTYIDNFSNIKIEDHATQQLRSSGESHLRYKHIATSPLRLNYDYNKIHNKHHVSADYYQNDNKIVDYEVQIAELHVKLNELQHSNAMLQTRLVENATPSDFPIHTKMQHDVYVNDQIIRELQNIYGNVPREALLDLCRKHSSQVVELNKLRELKSKLKSLYLSLYNMSKDSKVSVKCLWRWIKNVVRHASKQPKESSQDTVEYQVICQQIIKDYNLKDLNDLKRFISVVLSRNEKNKRNVDKINKILSTHPNESKQMPTQSN